MSECLTLACRRNFTKVLVNREGKPVGRYTSMQDPLGLKAAIEALL